MALAGKWALVTGASKGVGEAIAHSYAREGAKLVLTATNKEKLQHVAKACVPIGAEAVETYALDLSNFPAVDNLAKELLEKHKRIDVIVNNAGILGVQPDEQEVLGEGPHAGDPDQWTELFKINVLAPMRLVRWLSPAMIEKGEGYIINIASIAGTFGEPGSAVYASSKAAMVNWSEATHNSLVSKGIKVLSLNPAMVATDMTLKHPWVGHKLDPSKENQPEDIGFLALVPFKTSRWCNIRDLTTTNMVSPVQEE